MNLLWFLSGATSTAVPFMLDAAAMKFNLSVSDRSFILVGSKTNGLLTGFICGLCADLYGRSTVIKVVLLWIAFCLCFLTGANTAVMFGAFLVFMASGRDGYVNVTNALIVEWNTAKHRVWSMILPHASWNVGRGYASLMWTLIRPDKASPEDDGFDSWNKFILSIAIPALILAIAWMAVGYAYESPRQMLAGQQGGASSCSTTRGA